MGDAKPLTTKQTAFFRLLMRLNRQNGVPPTVRELQVAAKMRSTRGVTQFLGALERAGFISRADGARNIRILGGAPTSGYLKGIRLSLTISPQASKMIDDLLRTGLWGVSGRAGVAQELIYRGLREQLRPQAKGPTS